MYKPSLIEKKRKDEKIISDEKWVDKVCKRNAAYLLLPVAKRPIFFSNVCITASKLYITSIINSEKIIFECIFTLQNWKGIEKTPWFNPWFIILLHTKPHLCARTSRQVLIVLEIYNFAQLLTSTFFLSAERLMQNLGPVHKICLLLAIVNTALSQKARAGS